MAQNGNKNDIPLTTETAGLFTYNEGFPPITQVSVKAGGKAPQRNDFNGALNELSQHIFFLQNGGKYRWNEELDYAAGAEILGSDNNIYQALQISGPSSGGAKDPTAEENAAYWEKIQTVKNHNEDLKAHEKLIAELKKSLVLYRTGDFLVSFNSTIDGFLLCDGSAVNRETYADLFAVIGTTFGEGDGSTTFNLPDFRGRFIQGANGDLGSVKAAGLPNITGVLFDQYGVNQGASSGAFTAKDARAASIAGGLLTNSAWNIDFDASDSNPIYGASETVQPPAIALNVFIKY